MLRQRDIKNSVNKTAEEGSVSPLFWNKVMPVEYPDSEEEVLFPFRGINTEMHKSDHNLAPIDGTNDATVMDGDYLIFEQRNKFKYNYLDPNFQPNSKVSWWDLVSIAARWKGL